MPRGRGRGGSGHKGQRRHFTNPDQLAQDKEKEERERKWREQRGEISSEESEEKSESSSEEEEESEDGLAKAKGVQHLIEVENPNRVVKKEKKVSQLEPEEEEAPQLSRREREELEKQKAKAHYLKMHAAGRTSEAKADLARLAIIKKQREDAAKKREEEIKAKEAADSAKKEAKNKALGKKS